MREMRLAKERLQIPEVLKEIVEECDTVRLGLTDAEGMFIVPVNYGYEFTEENGKAELQLYFHGAAEEGKAEMLKFQRVLLPLKWIADTDHYRRLYLCLFLFLPEYHGKWNRYPFGNI